METTSIIIAILGSGAFTTVVSAVMASIDRKRATKEAKEHSNDEFCEVVKEGFVVNFYDRIRYLGNKYLEDGKIDFDDRRNLRNMHKVYKKFGGNGDFDVLMSDIDELPLKH